MTAVDQLTYLNFERATVKANWSDRLSWLTRKDNDLISLDEILACLPVDTQRFVGLQSVRLDRIVGSEGRHHEFNRSFQPRQDHTRFRWMSIDKAYYKDVHLPPIELVKIDQVYFVRDGNHRVSVARARGQVFIDARVTEIKTPYTVDGSQHTFCPN